MGQLEEGKNRGNLLCLAGRLEPWDSWKRGKTGEICSACLVGWSHGTAGREEKQGKSALPGWWAGAMGQLEEGKNRGEVCSAWLVGCSHGRNG